MSDEQSKIQTLRELIGLNEQSARHILESCQWDIETAAAFALENPDEVDIENSHNSIPTAPTMDQPPPPYSSTAPMAPSKTKPSTGRIQTLAGLNKDDDDDENGQAFYAGGSETSGQQVLGPKKNKKTDAENIIKDVFAKARELGATENAPGTSSSQPQHFLGSGVRLGDTFSPSTQVAGSSSNQQPLERKIRITFWKNGISLKSEDSDDDFSDDEDVRPYDDPNTQRFLSIVKTGRAPPELMKGEREVAISLAFAEEREHDFEKPKKKLKPFKGGGQRLGGAVTPNPVSSTSTPHADATVDVDTAAPTTSIQLRLHDGSRVVQKFNVTHTVGDIRRFVAARSGAATFSLMTTFPNRVLDDDAATVAAARLENSCVVQRLL